MVLTHFVVLVVLELRHYIERGLESSGCGSGGAIDGIILIWILEVLRRISVFFIANEVDIVGTYLDICNANEATNLEVEERHTLDVRL